MLILSETDVEQLLPVPEAIQLVRSAYISYSRGDVLAPPRLGLPLGERGATLLSMPATDGRRYAGVKLVSVQPENAGRGIPVVSATYQLFDAVTCEPLALLGATRLTAIRTGAGGGVAADLLANSEAHTLGLIGAGAQAETQLLAVLAVRPIRRVLVYARSRWHIEAFIERMASLVNARLEPATSAEEAVAAAQILVTATNSSTPVFDPAALQAGTHISAIGAFTPQMQEIPDEIVAQAHIFVDAEDAAWAEAGDLLGPVGRGRIARNAVRGEIGQVAAGVLSGRGSRDEVTLFKSVGLAAQDLVCAAAVFERASDAGIGVRAAL